MAAGVSAHSAARGAARARWPAPTPAQHWRHAARTWPGVLRRIPSSTSYHCSVCRRRRWVGGGHRSQRSAAQRSIAPRAWVPCAAAAARRRWAAHRQHAGAPAGSEKKHPKPCPEPRLQGREGALEQVLAAALRVLQLARLLAARARRHVHVAERRRPAAGRVLGLPHEPQGRAVPAPAGRRRAGTWGAACAEPAAAAARAAPRLLLLGAGRSRSTHLECEQPVEAPLPTVRPATCVRAGMRTRPGRAWEGAQAAVRPSAWPAGWLATRARSSSDRKRAHLSAAAPFEVLFEPDLEGHDGALLGRGGARALAAVSPRAVPARGPRGPPLLRASPLGQAGSLHAPLRARCSPCTSSCCPRPRCLPGSAGQGGRAVVG